MGHSQRRGLILRLRIRLSLAGQQKRGQDSGGRRGEGCE